MNLREKETHLDPPTDEQRLLDRLVDGELGEAERRQLLASFDARPDGWRRCALAFLEAQSFACALGEVARPGPDAESSRRPAARSDVPAAVPQSIVSVDHSQRHAPSLVFAFAAAFLLAFGLGWMIRQPGQRSLSDEGPGRAPAISALADAGLAGSSNVNDAPRAPERWDTVTLVMDDGARGQREVQLPVVESSAADDSWIDRVEPVVPLMVRDALERLGHRVAERRQFLPLDLDDGRQVIVPIDEVEFTPLQANVYQ